MSPRTGEPCGVSRRVNCHNPAARAARLAVSIPLPWSLLMSHRLLAILAILVVPAMVGADAFDNYVNPILAKVPESKDAEKVAKVTAAMMVQNSRARRGSTRR